MRRAKQLVVGVGTVLVIVVAVAAFGWSHLINRMLPADSRPARIEFPVDKVTDAEFETLAARAVADFGADASHAARFREAGIRAYEGPVTCERCHASMGFTDPVSGEPVHMSPTDDLVRTVHYRFASKRHPEIFGFDGSSVDTMALGKINRPCPKPGSFAMTAWAEVVTLDDGRELSEGCGQCHVGGQYQAPLGEMMPGYSTLQVEKDALDCLICHSLGYDMNEKQVVTDANGRNRWGQDRSLFAAMTVTRPTSRTCLRCHQHNFGGDIYIDPKDPSFMESLQERGTERPRVLHPGSKRGTPFSPSWDVHAAAGVQCLDCHPSEGHRIARGEHTTTQLANDLPGRALTCQRCHGTNPHKGTTQAMFYNGHVAKIACESCHIPSLHEDNVSRRDFATTVFEEEEGIHIYNDERKDTEPGVGIRYVWWSGDGGFLGNPIGDNPNGAGLYRFYAPEAPWPEFADFDYEGWFEREMRALANRRPSKLYAVKRFNGRQHIDLQNIGPFGGMFVPYNLPTYYRTGDPDLAARTEMRKPMMKMMYGTMFELYMLDDFMGFMSVDGWNTAAYDDLVAGRKVEPRWLPADASLEIAHAIRRDGALSCDDCHAKEGVLDWAELGYTPAEQARLKTHPLKTLTAPPPIPEE